MAFCSNCGAALNQGANFCPVCGARQQVIQPHVQPVKPVQIVIQPKNNVKEDDRSDYVLVLYSIGTCKKEEADDVLEDFLGYSDYQARKILLKAPLMIADKLTRIQSKYLAQVLSEYGMKVAVYSSRGYENFDPSESSVSVFSSDGKLSKSAELILSGLTAENKVEEFESWDIADSEKNFFVPGFKINRPVHVRRSVFKEIAREGRERFEAARKATEEKAAAEQKTEEKKKESVFGNLLGQIKAGSNKDTKPSASQLEAEKQKNEGSGSGKKIEVK